MRGVTTDGLWLAVGIFLGLPLLLFLWVHSSGKTGSSKRTEAELDALRRAAGLYMGPLPEAERRAFETASTIVRARVLSRYQTGETINLRVVLDISLRVLVPEGSYDVEITEPVAYVDLARFAEGNEIDVYANPNDRTKVLLCDPEIAAIHRL